MHSINENKSFLAVNIAIATISDTREAHNDTSGDTLAARIVAAGHALVGRAIIHDDASSIET
ncbi:MAG: molybdenum cofactor biosynthesis protein, partial [Acidocella sp. 20-61-6]